MQTKFILLTLTCFTFLFGQSQISTSDRGNAFLKKVNSLDLTKLRNGQYDTLIAKTSDFTFTNDSINPIILAKLFKLRGDLRLEQFQKKEKLTSAHEIEDAEYSYARASDLDPSIKCSCLKKLKQLYKLNLFAVDNPEEKKRDTNRQIKKNC